MGKILKILTGILKLPLLNFIPKGYLTKASGYLQVVVGVGLLAQHFIAWTETGEAPDTITLQNIFGMILMSNGAGTVGLRRAIENGGGKS